METGTHRDKTFECSPPVPETLGAAYFERLRNYVERLPMRSHGTNWSREGRNGV